MLPANFHDATYDHIWSKIMQELKKRSARNTRAILKSKLRAMANQIRVLHKSITLKNLSYFHDLLTVELRDYAT